MRIGIALPQYDVSVAGPAPLDFATIVDWAQSAERLGFDSVWLSDHVRWDITKYGGPPGESGVFEPLVTLGALAAVTERVRLGTLVLLEALRPPAVLAKALATIDRVSAGRLDVGLGAGWYEPDYAALGTTMPPPGTRLARLGEAVQVVTALLAGDTVDFEGAHYAVRGAQLLPPPVQRPRPPVFAGGKGDRLLRLVARHADGWNTCWTWTVEAYRERRDALTRACDAEGRDPASVRRSLGLYTLTGEDEADLARRFERLATLTPPGVLAGHDLDTWRKGRLVGPVQDLRQMVDEWAALGVDEIICGLGAVPFQVSTLDDLELVAHALR